MKAGRIETYIHSDGVTENKVGCLVKVTCASDFAARIFEFKEFTRRVAQLACGFQAETYEELIKQIPSIEHDRLALEGTMREKVTVTDIVLLKL